jgi:hypothetical protein
MIRDEQCHSLPAEPVDLARLSVNLGAAGLAVGHARASTRRANRWRGNSGRCCSALRRAPHRRRMRPARAGWPPTRPNRGGAGGLSGFPPGEIAAAAALGHLPARGLVSAAGRGGAAASACHPGPPAEGGRGPCRARPGGAAVCCGCWRHRHALVLPGAAEGAAGGARPLDRGVRHQRLSVAADRRFSAAAGRVDRRQGVR